MASEVQNKKPGRRPGLLLAERHAESDQAAGLNSFDALALIGSTVSVATFWASSASSLAWAEMVSNCFLAWEVHSSTASDGDLMPSSSCAKSSVRGGVGLHEFHQLGGIFAGALAGAGEDRLDGAVVALGDVLELGVAVAGLRNALFGERAHLLGNFNGNDGGGERIGELAMACILRRLG